MASPILTRKETPIALDAVRKKILRDVKSIEKEVQLFLDRYSGNVGTPSNWGRYISAACEAVEETAGQNGGHYGFGQGQGSSINYESITDYNQLDVLLKRVRGHPRLDNYRSREYDELRRMTERGRMFEYIEYTLKNDLVATYEDRLDKFCVSFYDESYGDSLKSVKQYEDRIEGWRQEVQTHLNKVDDDMDQIDRYTGCGSLREYIDNYPTVVRHMEDSCRGIVASCQPMKSWLAYDAQYTKHLQEDINTYLRRRKDLTEVIGSTQESRDREERKLRRVAGERQRFERQLLMASDRLKMLRAREQGLRDNNTRTNVDFQNKQRELQECERKAAEAQRNIRNRDTSVFDYWKEMEDETRHSVQTLRNKLETQIVQLDRLKREQASVQIEMNRLASEVEARAEGEEIVTARMNKHVDDLDLIRDDIDVREDRVATLKKIREAKLHSHILRNIEKYGYNPSKIIQAKSVINDETREAFAVTADAIGKDWEALYRQLPFKPDRDQPQRTRDIEVIDISNRRLDEGYDLLAYKALEKWRRLSSVATIDQLVKTLRKMKRYDIADRIPLDGHNTGRSTNR